VLCARETQKSIQESVHRLLKDQIGALGLKHLFDVQETKIVGKNGSDFAFAGVRQQGVANLKSFEARTSAGSKKPRLSPRSHGMC
jgi:phage terminase large subunit